jgi:hypothetical protein
MTYLRKFLFLTYQDRKFSGTSSKNGTSTTSPGSSKTKKTTAPSSGKTASRKESKSSLPQPEPLSNILGPNIPSLDVGTSPSSNKSTRTTAAPKTDAPLINLLDDSPIAPSNGNSRVGPSSSSSSSSNKDLLGDLMSLSVAPAPTTSMYGVNPFQIPSAAAAAAPAVDPHQIAQLQNQVQNMQTAILSAKQQMTAVQEQIQRGQAVFAQLNPQQRELLAALLQRYQAMNTQFTAMNQQYTMASTKLQQMLAAAAAPPPAAAVSQPSLFDSAFGGSGGATSTNNGMFGAATGGNSFNTGGSSTGSLYGTSNTSSSSTNLFGTAPTTTTTNTSSSNLFGGASSTYSTTSSAPATNGYNNTASQSNMFGYGTAAPSTNNTSYGAPRTVFVFCFGFCFFLLSIDLFSSTIQRRRRRTVLTTFIAFLML